MERPVTLASVGALVFFGGMHLWMRFEGSPASEIQAVLLGWLGFSIVASIGSAGLRGVGFGDWCLVMVPVSLVCGISILGITYPIAASLLGITFLIVAAWIEHQVYLDTPYDPGVSPRYGVHPTFGTVMIGGEECRTLRDVQKAARRMRKMVRKPTAQT